MMDLRCLMKSSWETEVVVGIVATLYLLTV